MIRIKVKKDVNGNLEKGYQVTEIEALGINELPDAYKEGFHCFKSHSGSGDLLIVDNHSHLESLVVGMFYTEDDFNHRLKLVKQCGNRLKDINNKIRKLKSEWNGNVEVRI